LSIMVTDAPPAFLLLAAHPLRWRLLSELARSDRMVHELTTRLGEAQNLISYHLGKLRNARLVVAKRSSADRRDTYYGLDLPRLADQLEAAGGALHPGLRLTPQPQGAVVMAPANVLFLCTGNSARSPMAAALAQARSGGAIKAVSAGSHPRPLHPNALKVMGDAYGLDLTAHRPTHLDSLLGQDFDWVISLCDRVREVCPEFPGQTETVHWSIANPATGEADALTYPQFEKTAAELASRIDFLLAMLADSSSRRQQ
jgi:protein-tyrosine-phosphatase/DNA-binding transcriptional ArsR family regulator